MGVGWGGGWGGGQQRFRVNLKPAAATAQARPCLLCPPPSPVVSSQFSKILVMTIIPLAIVIICLFLSSLFGDEDTWMYNHLIPARFRRTSEDKERIRQWSVSAFNLSLYITYLCLPATSAEIAKVSKVLSSNALLPPSPHTHT